MWQINKQNYIHMNIPENFKYTKDHEWIHVEGNIAKVGITDFAQSELGDIVFVEIETEGEDLKREAVFGTIEAVKTVSDLYMPLSGKILEVNPDLGEQPDLVNKDPYGSGWMVKIEIANAEEIEQLLSFEQYKSLIG